MKNNITIRTFNAHCVATYEHVSNGVGVIATCFSYNTPVFQVDADNNFHRLWDGWSATTQRDINTAFPGVKMNKKTWNSMEVE